MGRVKPYVENLKRLVFDRKVLPSNFRSHFVFEKTVERNGFSGRAVPKDDDRRRRTNEILQKFFDNEGSDCLKAFWALSLVLLIKTQQTHNRLRHLIGSVDASCTLNTCSTRTERETPTFDLRM